MFSSSISPQRGPQHYITLCFCMWQAGHMCTAFSLLHCTLSGEQPMAERCSLQLIRATQRFSFFFLSSLYCWFQKLAQCALSHQLMFGCAQVRRFGFKELLFWVGGILILVYRLILLCNECNEAIIFVCLHPIMHLSHGELCDPKLIALCDLAATSEPYLHILLLRLSRSEFLYSAALQHFFFFFKLKWKLWFLQKYFFKPKNIKWDVMEFSKKITPYFVLIFFSIFLLKPHSNHFLDQF